MIFCVWVRSAGVDPPAVSLGSHRASFFVNGDLLCYDGRMDEWEEGRRGGGEAVTGG